MNNTSSSNLICGLTGSIAVGKSTVTKFIRKLGIPVVDADVIAREVVVPGSVGLGQVIDAFGKEYLLPNGTLDRPALGMLVSTNPDKLSMINKIMHPLIVCEAENQLNVFCTPENPIIFYDSALIIETGKVDRFRPLVVVWTNLETQISRLMARNSINEEIAKQWISLQLSSDEKVKYADYVIKTTGTLEELEQEIQSIIDTIKATHYERRQTVLCG